MKRLGILAVFFVPLLFASPAPAAITPMAERENWNRPVPEWREGPVRYLLTDEENQGYRSVTTSGARAAFIARFWAARDPSPFTPPNEAEEVFWRRVRAADELFTQTTLSGWRTDQGRVYILLGPPDEITNYPVPSVEELDRTHFPEPGKLGSPTDLRRGQRGAVEWVYRSLAGPRTDAGQLVTFVRDETGEFRLSGRLAVTFRPIVLPRNATVADLRANTGGNPRAASADAGGTVAIRNGGAADSALSDRFEEFFRSAEDAFSFGQAAVFQKAEPPAQPAGRVTSQQFFGVVPIQSRLDFFGTAAGTRTLITLGISSDEGASTQSAPQEIQIFGQLQRFDDVTQVYRFSSVKTASDPVVLQSIEGKEHRLYQVRGELPPGSYHVDLGARIGNRIGTASDQVEVPDFGGEALLLAGPVLTESLGEPPQGDEGKAFRIGRLRLVPKMDVTYRPGSDFGFYYEVHHAHPGPDDGRFHLDLEYQVAVRRGGVFRPQGKPVTLPDNSAPTHAYTFPLTGWLPGEYLLTVTAVDQVTGQARSEAVAFKIE